MRAALQIFLNVYIRALLSGMALAFGLFIFGMAVATAAMVYLGIVHHQSWLFAGAAFSGGLTALYAYWYIDMARTMFRPEIPRVEDLLQRREIPPRRRFAGMLYMYPFAFAAFVLCAWQVVKAIPLVDTDPLLFSFWTLASALTAFLMITAGLELANYAPAADAPEPRAGAVEA